MKGRIEINRERCKGCELCIAFCPKHLIAAASRLNAAGYFPAVCAESIECTGCMACALVCPEVAIEVYRER
jgi:2-oxoglutarate ferredoxin oxidoreductase subunit delta